MRVALVLLLVGLLIRQAPHESALPLEMSFFFLAILFISPVSWISHYIVLLVPYSYAINEITSNPAGAPGRCLLVWTVVVSTLLAAFNNFSGLQSYSLLFFGSLVLFGGLLGFALRVRPQSLRAVREPS